MPIKGNITPLLQQKYRDAGYELSESEDFVELYHNGKNIGVFSSHGCTIYAIEALIERLEKEELNGSKN